MERYVFEYQPVWGRFTVMAEYVMANNPEQAKIKFYLSEAGENCAILFRYYKG